MTQICSSSNLYNLFTTSFVMSLFSSSKADSLSSVIGLCTILDTILLDMVSIRSNSLAVSLSFNLFSTLSASHFRIASACSLRFEIVGNISADFSQFSKFVCSSSRMNSASFANYNLASLLAFTTSCKSSTS